MYICNTIKPIKINAMKTIKEYAIMTYFTVSFVAACSIVDGPILGILLVAGMFIHSAYLVRKHIKC